MKTKETEEDKGEEARHKKTTEWGIVLGHRRETNKTIEGGREGKVREREGTDILRCPLGGTKAQWGNEGGKRE